MVVKHHTGQNMDNKYDGFEKRYQIKKTIRMGLIPQGRTLEYIKDRDLLGKDEKRAEDYQKLKKIIDRYHRKYIEEQLKDTELTGVEECYKLYLKKKNGTLKSDKELNKKLNEKLKELREQVHYFLISGSKYDGMFKEELINKDLSDVVKNDDEEKLVMSFKGYTTYLQGFYDNRKLLYSKEGKHGTIAYRTIDQNMLRYFDNIKLIEKFINGDKKHVKKVETDYRSELGGKSLEEYFSADNYSAFITQSGIDEYNKIIGGYSVGKKKIQGINEYINQFNQAKKAKLGILRPLYKQILSEKTSASFLPVEFKEDQEVIDSLKKFSHDMAGTLSGIEQIFCNIAKYDQSGIYLKYDKLGDVSKCIFTEWNVIKDALSEYYDTNYSGNNKKGNKNYNNEKEKYFKNLKSISADEIKNAMSEDVLKEYSDAIVTLIGEIHDAENDLQGLLKSGLPKGALSKNDATVKCIKTYLDSVKKLQRHMRPLLGNEDEADSDAFFYGDFLKCWDELDEITSLYDRVRNYVTKKPYSTEKLKLKFDNSQLMAGWAATKEKDYLAVIMRRKGKYYLGIMDKGHKDIFENLPPASGKDCYEKMRYMQLREPYRDFAKFVFSDKWKGTLKPPQEISDIRSNESYKFNIDDCHKFIDFYKDAIKKHPVWKEYGFKFSDTKDYRNFSEFCQEAKLQAYKITFQSIPEATINDYVDKGWLYLFQIWNKDFSDKSKGTPNLHTRYWEMLFDQKNLADVVYKLDAGAEFFYRKASIQPNDVVKHPANNPIENRHPHNKKESIFAYDIIKDRRYTEDKFECHFKTTLNFKADKKADINTDVRKYIKDSEDLHIIGIDRGERNLIYISVIDSKGEIVEQCSLNQIKGKEYTTDYHELLDKKEKARAKARIDWTEIQNIKELKEGYLSQVVHKICELMMKYEAIVVLEDLNEGFKNSRKKVEKQVYQKFERMLIEKLNFYVDKKAKPDEPMGLLHARQLTNKFESFEKLHEKKQSGFIFYVPAAYTSKIDPCTGFVNLFPYDVLHYSSVKKSQDFWREFKSISYDDKRDMFAFTFDYGKFTNKADGSQKEWTVYSYGDRLENRKNPATQKYESHEVKLTDEFKKLFKSNGIYYKNDDLKVGILSCNDKNFHESLLHLFKLTLQLRNSETGTEIDYMASPVMNSKGEFFDTRNSNSNSKLPLDADANGAYNIAKKGLWIVEKLKDREDGNLYKTLQRIGDKDWFKYAQDHKING